MNSYTRRFKKNISSLSMLVICSMVIVMAFLGVTNDVFASDKYGGGSSSDVSGDSRYEVRTNPNSNYSTVSVTNRSTGQVSTYSDWNGDGNYNGPNERMTSGPVGGSDRSDSSDPGVTTCSGIDIAVTGIRLEQVGASVPPPSRFSNLFGAFTTSDLVVGASYIPVVTVQNVGCSATNSTNPFPSGLSGIFSRTASTGNYRNTLPFGANGGFPVQLAIDLNNDGTFERVEYTNNQGPLAAGQAITLRFPSLTVAQPGPFLVRAIADPAVAQAPGNTCPADASGDWGCVLETGTGANNQRLLQANAAGPVITLGSFILSPDTRNFFLASITGVSTASERDISSVGGAQRMGLYWTGQAVDFSTCRGDIRSASGQTLSGFSGQRDTTGLTFFTLSQLPTVADRIDANIPEPGSDERYTYTITCTTTGGGTVSDSVALYRGNVALDPVTPGVPVVPGVVPACSDNVDNDGDGLIDENDPGCWTDPLDPSTYDPSRPDERSVPTGGPLSIGVQPTVVRRGGPVQVTWNTGGNTGCVVTGAGLNIPVASGVTETRSVAVNAQTTFVIACNAGRRAEAVVQVLPVIYES